MNKKLKIILILLLLCLSKLICKEQLNLIPMYGGDKITKKQKRLNNKFVKDVIKLAGSKEKADSYFKSVFSPIGWYLLSFVFKYAES